MKKILILLLLIASPLAAKSYLSEYRGHGYIVIFQGDIKEGNEDEVRSLQTQYLESMLNPRHRDRNYNLGVKLGKLGVKVSKIKDDPYIDLENATPCFTPDRH